MSGRTGRKKAEELYAIEERSLFEFLENEPDLYTVSDIQVRYE
jgi:hypothetical protein